MRKFFVSVEGMTNTEDAAFIEYLKNVGIDWWHWIPGTWLLIDPSATISSATVRDKLKDITSKKHCIVLNASDHSAWAGHGPNSESKNMFTWIRNRWTSKE